MRLLGWMGPFHLQATNGPKKSKHLNVIQEVREKKSICILVLEGLPLGNLRKKSYSNGKSPKVQPDT